MGGPNTGGVKTQGLYEHQELPHAASTEIAFAFFIYYEA